MSARAESPRAGRRRAMLVALEGPAENYIDRLAHLTMQGKIRLAVDD